MTISLANQAILFDLDGTLVDSAPDLWRATNHVLTLRGHAALPLELVRDYVGNGARFLLARGFWGLDATPPVDDPDFESAVQEFLAYYRLHITDHSHPYPGVMEALELLKQRDVPLGIVTNKPESLTHLMLDQLELTPYFRVVVGGDTLPERKPHPLPMQHAMRLLETSEQQTVMIGDSETDSMAARNAGCRIILVSHGYNRGLPLENLQPDGIIHHFNQLIDLLGQPPG
ncbi:MAG: phosphoglycolate phosphatase [Magnetococcales bacterium]|nr:phosphoglycolate phosphatase [Magnetococcales bacterium]MBF0150941.1 phosphoglycolate phosphatase [Magnetococcales bacterium]MBF0631968.1 phosphoglycolate phosphatase [Magnetococcales bacterium]